MPEQSTTMSKIKHRTPEIIVGLSVIAGIAGAIYFKRNMPPKELFVAIPTEKADSILVLEQIGFDLYRDMDFGLTFNVTPVPS